jgi:glucokinase
LGELVKLICYVLDPELIILGGSVSKSYRFYKDALNDSMKSCFFKPARPVKIVPSNMPDVAIYGAGSLFSE